MVMVKDPKMASTLKMLILHGLDAEAWKRYGTDNPRHYEVTMPGRKGNMSDVHAAIGLTQLRRWPEMKEKRRIVLEVYEKAFGVLEEGHSGHLFTIYHPKRDALRKFLFDRNIGTGIHYTPLHLEPAYRLLGYNLGDFPQAEWIGANTLSLPVSSTMTKEDAEEVVVAIKEFDENTK